MKKEISEGKTGKNRKSNNFRFFSWVICASLALSGVYAAKASADQLENPGFETAGETSQKAYDWQDFYSGYKRVKQHHSGSWGILLNKTSSSGDPAGAYQRIDLNQKEQKPVFVGAFLKGQNLVNDTSSFLGASVYAEIHLTSGKVVYWNSIRNEGTFGWNWIGFNTGTLGAIDAPIDHIFVVPVLAGTKGKAWFDDIQVVEYEPAKAAVTVMIDDGEDTTYTAAKPIMDKYGFSGSAAVIVNEVGKEGYMTWSQLKDLSSAGWEIVSHGLAHVDLTTLNATKLRQELANSKNKLAKQGFKVNNFAIPFGAYNGTVLSTGAKYYKSMRLYEQGANPEGTYPFDVKVRGVLNTTTLGEVSSWIEEAEEKKQWLILSFHTVAEAGDDAYHTNPENFDQMMRLVKDSGIDVMTYDQAVDAFKASPESGSQASGSSQGFISQVSAMVAQSSAQAMSYAEAYSEAIAGF